jgi:hypothetical protein
LVRSASAQGPTRAEESAAVPLLGGASVGQALGVPLLTHLFIRVRRPFGAAASASPSTPLSATHPISRVVAAIRSRAVRTTLRRHLVLPAGIKWPCASNNILYVRECYAPLYESVLQRCRPDQDSTGDYWSNTSARHIITGQPGIGKSVFGWYMIHRLLTEQPDRTIVYSRGADGVEFVIPPSGPVTFSRMDPDAGASPYCISMGMTDPVPDAVLIADSFLPLVTPFPTYALSSPDRVSRNINAKDILNNYSEPLYMPLPTESEILDMRRVAFSDLPEAGVLGLMSAWGPIPRHVLVRVSVAAQTRLAESVASVSLAKVEQLLASGGDGTAGPRRAGSDAPHRVAHVTAAGQEAARAGAPIPPTDPLFYRKGKIRFATPYVVRALADASLKKRRWDLAELLDASAGFAPLAGSRGVQFEDVALRLLECPTTFDVRALLLGTRSRPRVRKLPPTSTPVVLGGSGGRVVWGSVDDLAGVSGGGGRKLTPLLVPSRRSEAGIDALVWSGSAKRYVAINCTVSPRHSFRPDAVIAAAEALGWTAGGGWPGGGGSEISFYWVVPADKFDDWVRAQPPATGAMLTQTTLAAAAHIVQYVARVPPVCEVVARAAAGAEAGGASDLLQYVTGIAQQIASARRDPHDTARPD